MEKTIYIDLNRCSGCGACVVACLDQNDIEVGEKSEAFRRIRRVESGEYPEVSLTYISMACMHCEDSPCSIGCPTGAIAKDSMTGAIVVKSNICIGCHSCSLACPFGVPRFGDDDKMRKCNLCTERVAYGLEPACVRVCPAQALRFGSINALQNDKEQQAVERIVSSISR
jgi:anaerobic dimethyl sulfoxide reductase subunit B (iron-sulfur subunit)